MSDPQIWRRVREFIGDQEIDSAIRIMENWLKGRLNHFPEKRVSIWLDELLLHLQELNRIALRSRTGLLTQEAEGVALARLSQNLLKLVRIVELQDQKDPVALPELKLGASDQVRYEKILGSKSHLQMVGWLRRGVECSSGVCRIVSDLTRGTGFRIQRDLILTNHHVISQRDQVGQYVAQFFFEEGLDRKIREPVPVSFDAERFWTSADLDITIVGANFGSSSLNDITALPLSSYPTPEAGDAVTIVQHPLGGPKQIAIANSNVLDVVQVIAVHHAGGVRLKAENGEHRFANQGCSVQAIRASTNFSFLTDDS